MIDKFDVFEEWKNTFKKVKLDDELIKACEDNQLQKVKSLLSQGANIEAKNKELDTPLTVSILNGNINITHYLISQGANLNHKNIYGNTCLDYVKHLWHHNYKIQKAIVEQKPEWYHLLKKHNIKIHPDIEDITDSIKESKHNKIGRAHV